MKLGVLSDAHGNTFALKKCIDFLKEEVDEIYFLGDTCGYFPDLEGVIDLLQKNNVHAILGNHDAMLLGDTEIGKEKDLVYQLGHKKESLAESYSNYLKGLQTSCTVQFNGLNVLMVHGSPTNHTYEYVYEDSSFDKWENIDYDVVLMGHTHRSYVKQVNNTQFINAGSCGLPRDNGNMFSMAILDLEKKEYTIKKLEISIDAILDTYSDVHESVKNCLKRNNI